VLAPTGTIGLLMDCDTTGIEPDFALVKFKKLAGGGYFKIVNQSIPEALKKLNYNDREIAEIIEYAMGTLHFRGTPHINYEFLKSKGFLDEEIKKMENALTGAFHVSQVFSSHTLGEATLKRLGLFGEKNILKALGLTDAQIDEANDVICGRMTVEGAPHLKEEHLAVFDCANKCGSKGKRFIDPMGHIKMMAAAQPFLSGAISKTVNLPHEATVEDIEKIYMESWKLGLKAVALYRDGCKLSQPLSTSSKDSKESKKENTSPQPLQAGVVTNTNQASTMAFTPMRRRLPRKRGGFTVEAKIDGHKVYLRTGEYEDGKLGEIFIDMHKEGAPFRSMLNCFAIAVSLGLQYGVPLEDFVDVFTFTRFEPQGMVDHPNIKSATSVIDFIFRVLGMEYLHRTDFVHVKPEEKKADTEVAKVNSSWTSQQENLESNTQSEDENQVSLFSKENDKRISAGSGFATQNSSSILSQQLAQMMGDAPLCNVCGHTTVRNGACYKCLNCGNSLGCS
jgi:ribonucleoside-diphosphate reductase alpha chain